MLTSNGPASDIVSFIFHFSFNSNALLALVKYDICPRHNHVMINLSEQVSRGTIVVEMENYPAQVRREVYNI